MRGLLLSKWSLREELTIPLTGIRQSRRRLLCFAGFSAAAQMSSPSVGENRTGRSGYAPACANEWQRGICEKPKVKCSACPNQAFLAVDDVSIERHLRGTDANGAPFVMGVYPMLADNTCWFRARAFA